MNFIFENYMSERISVSIQKKNEKENPIPFWNKEFRYMIKHNMYPDEIEFHYLIAEKEDKNLSMWESFLYGFFPWTRRDIKEKTITISRLNKQYTKIQGGSMKINVHMTEHVLFSNQNIFGGTVRHIEDTDHHTHLYMISTGNIERVVFKRDS